MRSTAPIVGAVRHTAVPEAWTELLAALKTDGVDVTLCEPGSARRGRTDFGLLVTDAARTREVLTEPIAQEIGWQVTQSVPGPRELTPGRATTDVSVLPLWMTPRVDAAAEILTRLGLRPRLRADSGEWADFSGTQGLAAVHRDESPDVVLAFEAVDLDRLAERMHRADLRADIVDQNYGRSLRIDDPDGGEDIMVNESMRDLYGYQRVHRERRPHDRSTKGPRQA